MSAIIQIFLGNTGGVGGGLYDFTSFTFTNGTQTGKTGPTLSNLLSSYDTVSNPWLSETAFFDTIGGIQLWTVPKDGIYRIEAWGARGGNNSSGHTGGLGARIRGDFSLTEGQILRIMVGQAGNDASYSCSGNSGGGGTFVIKGSSGTPVINDICVIAGGGGGGGSGATAQGRKDGTTNNNGQDGDGSANCGVGGSTGNGGDEGTGCVVSSGGGGGMLGDGFGGSGGGNGGLSFSNGGTGGDNGSNSNGPTIGGGFGCGGGGERGGGGGGGYSGGGGGGLVTCACSNLASGGGGGSYNNGTNQSNSSGIQNTHGKVTITLL